MEVGRRIFFDAQSGKVIVDTGEKSGDVRETTVTQDIRNYKILSQRVRSTFDFIELPFGYKREAFLAAEIYAVDVNSRTIKFTFAE